jgi:hypothetical protein
VGEEEGLTMAGFGVNAGGITARLNNLIENLQGDDAEQAVELARSETALLLKELDRFMGYTRHPEKGAENRLLNHAKEAGMDRGKLENLRREVQAGRAEALSGNLALALKRFKQALDYWIKPAKGE